MRRHAFFALTGRPGDRASDRADAWQSSKHSPGPPTDGRLAVRGVGRRAPSPGLGVEKHSVREPPHQESADHSARNNYANFGIVSVCRHVRPSRCHLLRLRQRVPRHLSASPAGSDDRTRKSSSSRHFKVARKVARATTRAAPGCREFGVQPGLLWST